MKASLLVLLFSVGLSPAWGNGLTDSLSNKKKDSLAHVSEVSGRLKDTWVDEYGVAHNYFDEGLLSEPGMDSIQYYIDMARSIFAKIKTANNYIKNLDEASQFNLPVGISKQIGGLSYDIAIQSIRLKPTHAELDVYMQFEVPQNGTVLTFMARGIKFTQKGGIVGDATLQLVGDYGINFSGNKSQIILKGSASQGNTYVTMDCDGFKEMGLDAQVKFSRDLMMPENADGSVGAGNVMASFTTVLSNWNDLVVQISLPSFQLSSLQDFSFSVKDAVFDFSDLRNAPNMQFPTGYQSTQMLPDNPNLWRGFYLRQLTVKLPSELKGKGDPNRTGIEAENVFIDNMGFTGSIKAGNILTIDKGDMNGWAFSLDSLQVSIKANELTSAGFKGKIVVPVSDEKTPFTYSAIINGGGNYLFNVSSAKEMSFNLWNAARVDIYPASYLEVKVINHKFLPKASLNGRMSVQGKLSEGGKGVELADITFENLIIQAEKPYIKVGNFSFGSEAAQQKMAGFPISINDIALKSLSDTEVGLDFNLKLNLVGENSGSFAADAGLTLVGKMDSNKGWQSWRYKTILVREIGVDIDGGAFKINGRLIFYRNDITYGDGFNGQVKAEFTPGIKLSTSAIFGSVDGLRYWYVDGMVNFPTALPIFSGVGIYGFGGGAYFAMKMDNTGAGSELGKTASGAVYIPDVKAGLGLKAIISLGSMPSGAFDADVTFEIAFFKGGGVRYISFGGNGSVATKGVNLDMDKMKGSVGKMVSVVKDQTSKLGAAKGLLDDGGDDGSLTKIFGDVQDKANQDGSISARVLISYDFENHILHGNFEVYVNVAGGIIAGVGPGGRAGWAVLHFAPHEWYIYAGTPSDRVGVKIGIGTINVAATSYFMVGTKILDSPPPPPEVSKILGGIDLDYMKDLNALGTRPGFAFGAGLSISTGELSFLMFYSSFSAGLGFDIMLKNYGDVYCKGSDKRLGINGWYANGQSYGYFEGAIGIKVKVFGRKKKIEILSIGAATVMQAKLPNPFWMRGIVGGYFSVLGGMVKGNCKFEVTLGHECEIVGDQNAILDEIKVISELTPANSESAVSVFNTPQALFNIPVEKTFELEDDISGLGKRSFRVKLDYFKLMDGQKELTGTLKWNNNNDVLAFNSYEILPPKKEISLAAQVSFEELKNDVWSPVITDGKQVTELLQQKFTTGEAPDYIPHENIVYTYPVIGQMNFYKDESKEGYIKLVKAQPYLFEPDPKWKQIGRFKTDDGSTSTFDFVYTYSTNMVTFSIPADLKSDKYYTVELVNIPATQSGTIDRNVSDVSNKVTADTEIVTKKAEGSIDELQEKSIFTARIRSSKYTSFANKIKALTMTETFRVLQKPWRVHSLISNLTFSESFDLSELRGNAFTGGSLVRVEANLDDNVYYNKDIYPLVYEGYPLDGSITITQRDPVSLLGVPPLKGVSIYQDEVDGLTIDQNSSNASSVTPTIVRYDYDLPLTMEQDFSEIQKKVADRYIFQKEIPERYARIIWASYPIIRKGYYKTKLKYFLPGKEEPSSVQEVTLYNSIGD